MAGLFQIDAFWWIRNFQRELWQFIFNLMYFQPYVMAWDLFQFKIWIKNFTAIVLSIYYLLFTIYQSHDLLDIELWSFYITCKKWIKSVLRRVIWNFQALDYLSCKLIKFWVKLVVCWIGTAINKKKENVIFKLSS